MTNAEEYLRLEQEFSEIALTLFASGTVEGTLEQIVRLAEEALDGCSAAGIIVVDEFDEARVVAAGSERARTLDRAQVEGSEGPCLDAARSGTTFYAADLADDVRWPGFSALAVETGVRSVLAYSISAQRLSALNLYAELPMAFGATDRASGQLFATLARLALEAAEVHAADALTAAGLTEALKTRELIGQAQGILMERERISSDQAFDVLRRASQHLNVKLRAVAARLVETGETPQTSGPVPRGGERSS